MTGGERARSDKSGGEAIHAGGRAMEEGGGTISLKVLTGPLGRRQSASLCGRAGSLSSTCTERAMVEREVSRFRKVLRKLSTYHLHCC